MFQHPPLILCPGLLNDAALWRHQVEALDDITTPVVADLTGCDSISALAQSILAKAPPRFALAGLSMGGYVAFEILRQAPERITHLALLNTSALPDTPEGSERRRVLIDLAQRGGFSKIPPLLLPNLVHPSHSNDDRIAPIVLEMADRIGAEAFIRQQTAIMTRVDSRPTLTAITCPTLVVSSQQDGLTPPALMADIATAISGARFEVVEESGHLTPLEQPQIVTALLRDWLQG